MALDAETRRHVRSRAGFRCEYCRLQQEAAPFFTFHVEHIIARQHGGTDELTNLALACHSCNLHKGPNLTGIDPETGRIEPLFNPRVQNWDDHFRVDNAWILGLTATGRTTVRVLALNSDEARELRSESSSDGLG